MAVYYYFSSFFPQTACYYESSFYISLIWLVSWPQMAQNDAGAPHPIYFIALYVKSFRQVPFSFYRDFCSHIHVHMESPENTFHFIHSRLEKYWNKRKLIEWTHRGGRWCNCKLATRSVRNLIYCKYGLSIKQQTFNTGSQVSLSWVPDARSCTGCYRSFSFSILFKWKYKRHFNCPNEYQ